MQDARNLFGIQDMQDEQLALRPLINSRIQPSEIRIRFEEICYMCKVTNFEVAQYFEMLRQRVRDIEQTIDHHFELIKKVIRQDKIDKMQRAKKRDEEEKARIVKTSK